jgi:hypothetical protein
MKVIRIIYICLLFGYIFSQTTPSDTISLTFKPSGDGDAVVEILQKGKSIDADATDYMITFNCKDFGDGEEMYFKIRAKEDAFYYDSRYNGVYYQYIDSHVGYDENKLEFVSYQFKTESEILPSGDYKIKYFTITKKKSQFRGTNGELLLIYFMIDYGPVQITNTLEDEGKFETWKIVVIVVVAVVVIGLIIGCYCYRRKKQLAMMNAQNAGTVGINQYNNAPYDPQYNQPVANYDVNQPYNQPYNQPIDNYGTPAQY